MGHYRHYQREIERSQGLPNAKQRRLRGLAKAQREEQERIMEGIRQSAKEQQERLKVQAGATKSKQGFFGKIKSRLAGLLGRKG